MQMTSLFGAACCKGFYTYVYQQPSQCSNVTKCWVSEAILQVTSKQYCDSCASHINSSCWVGKFSRVQHRNVPFQQSYIQAASTVSVASRMRGEVCLGQQTKHSHRSLQPNRSRSKIFCKRLLAAITGNGHVDGVQQNQRESLPGCQLAI